MKYLSVLGTILRDSGFKIVKGCCVTQCYILLCRSENFFLFFIMPPPKIFYFSFRVGLAFLNAEAITISIDS